ncbi:hypothetical protein PPG86_14445 [Thermoanaerobacterium thermosaccharolyticum]
MLKITNINLDLNKNFSFGIKITKIDNKTKMVYDVKGYSSITRNCNRKDIFIYKKSAEINTQSIEKELVDTEILKFQNAIELTKEQTIIVDGNEGIVIINPDADILNE